MAENPYFSMKLSPQTTANKIRHVFGVLFAVWVVKAKESD